MTMEPRFEIIDIIPDGPVVQPARWIAAADYAALEAENAKLRERIEQAPHGKLCGWEIAYAPCNCWKSAPRFRHGI